MIKKIKIFCEGSDNAFDKRILEKTLGDLPITLIPIGSKLGAKAIIQFHEKKIWKSDFYLFFRDRDFDFPIPNEEKLECQNYVCLTYRNTIENYLFNPEILWKFITKKKLNIKYNLKNLQDLKNKMIEAAKKIKFYQAIRHTLGALRENLDIGTKLTSKSGILPNNLSENFCKQEALKIIKQIKEKVEAWLNEKFEENYNKFVNKFNKKNFMNELRFLIYFQGKDYASAFKQVLKDFPLKEFFDFAIQNFNYEIFKDLVQLRQKVENNL